MSTDPNVTYFSDRAAQERAMADRANDPSIQALHRRMAALYEARLQEPMNVVRLFAAD